MTADRFEGLAGSRPYRDVADFYARHRHSVSEHFAAALTTVMGWTSRDRVLDLGAGPAQIARKLAPHVGHVVAADPEPEMLRAGERLARTEGIDNIDFVAADSDDLSPLGAPAGQFRAVMIGSAFHWMRDQDRVLRDLDGYLDAASGAVLVLAFDVGPPMVEPPGVDLRPWRDREPWSQVKATLDRYLAETPPGPHPAGRHDAFPAVFARSPFGDLEFLRWEYEREVRPSVDAAIEYAYTMSHVLARLGDRRTTFEAEVRDLLVHADTSPVRERLVDSALIARRPG